MHGETQRDSNVDDLFEEEILRVFADGPCQNLSRCEKSFVVDEFRDRSSWIASGPQVFFSVASVSPWFILSSQDAAKPAECRPLYEWQGPYECYCVDFQTTGLHEYAFTEAVLRCIRARWGIAASCEVTHLKAEMFPKVQRPTYEISPPLVSFVCFVVHRLGWLGA